MKKETMSDPWSSAEAMLDFVVKEIKAEERAAEHAIKDARGSLLKATAHRRNMTHSIATAGEEMMHASRDAGVLRNLAEFIAARAESERVAKVLGDLHAKVKLLPKTNTKRKSRKNTP